MRIVYPGDELAHMIIGFAMMVPVGVEMRNDSAPTMHTSIEMLFPLGELIIEAYKDGVSARIDWFVTRKVYTPALMLVSRLWESIAREAEILVSGDDALITRSVIGRSDGDVTVDMCCYTVVVPFERIAMEALNVIEMIAEDKEIRETVIREASITEKNILNIAVELVRREGKTAKAAEKITEMTRRILF